MVFHSFLVAKYAHFSFARTAGVLISVGGPSMVPLFQLIFGLNASSQGYPRIILSLPRSEMKN